MLSQFLPGLREIRGPLAAGYLWLLFGWLVFNASVPDAGGPVGELVDLGAAVSDAALAVAASFAAYLIGSLSEDGFRRLLTRFAAANVSREIAVEHPLLKTMDGMSGSGGEEEGPSPIADQERYEIVLPIMRDMAADLTNERDRLQAENVLRIAVIPPLTPVISYFVVEDPQWLAAALILPALFVQTYQRSKQIRLNELQIEAVWGLFRRG